MISRTSVYSSGTVSHVFQYCEDKYLYFGRNFVIPDKYSTTEFLKLSRELEIRSMERGICPIATLALRLTLYSLTGSRV